MKSILICLLCIGLLFGVSACKRSEQEQETTAKTEESVSEETTTARIPEETTTKPAEEVTTQPPQEPKPSFDGAGFPNDPTDDETKRY